MLRRDQAYCILFGKVEVRKLKKPLTVRFAPEIYEALKAISDDEDRSLSYVAEKAVAEWLRGELIMPYQMRLVIKSKKEDEE